MAYAYRQESQPLRIEETGHTAAFDKGEAIEQVDKTLHGHPRVGLLGWLLPIGIALAGLALIILGGRILVDAAIQLSRAIGLSEAVIGLTVVAVGTSLPEFVTSVVAAIRRQSDIAVGNVLGSNIYNVLGIGGVTGLIAPVTFPPEMLQADLFVMMAASILLFLFAWNGKVSRLEGLVLLSAYTAYTAYLLTR
jgi:cation:H+ antiporter